MRVECKEWHTLFLPSVLSEYSSLSWKPLSVWVTGCCVSWQQWCLHTDVQYDGSIAPMTEKKKVFATLKGSTVCQSGARSYHICCASWRKKLVSTLISLQQLLPLQLSVSISMFWGFFASFLVRSWTHQFSELLNLWTMSYICVLNENVRLLRCYSLTECSTTPAFHRFIG